MASHNIVKVIILLLSNLAIGSVAFSPPTAFISSIVSSSGNNNTGNSGDTATTSLKMSASTTTTQPEVKVGDKIPSVVLKEGQPNYEKPIDVDLTELIKGKKVIIFAVPGAFTPGCSKSHLPSFITAKDDLKTKGVDMIICVATNDAYVMEAWGEQSGGREAGIRFLSDGDAALTRALGLDIPSDVFVRSKRYSLIAEDGVVTHYFSSKENSSDTWAPAVLSSL